MIGFALTERDKDILEEARAQARLAAKYAREFERDEDRMLPRAYPEAEGRPDTRAMLREHLDETSGAKILGALLYLEDWRGGVPLRECRYSLGNAVLAIAGTPEQQARWTDRTIAIALTEPIGGSDPAATRTTATWDPAPGEWVIEGEKISESRPVVAAYALGVTRAAMDFTWARLNEAGVAPDYDAGPNELSAAADRMLALEAEWEAAYVAVLRAKWIEQNEGPGKIESSIVKAMGGALARNVVQTCIGILGASGLSEAHLPEKAFRDARIFDIYEGTGEIQRLIIARHILELSPKELN